MSERRRWIPISVRCVAFASLVAMPGWFVRSSAAAPPPPPPGPQLDFGKAWVAQGPTTMTNGQTEGLTNNEVIGAVHCLAAHPTNADILLLGSVHGGIWRTTSATSAEPTWTKVSSDTGGQAIGAIEYDPTNSNVLLAGFGYYSSFTRFNAILPGLLRSVNGGVTWTPIVDPLLTGENVSGVAIRGNILVVASNGFGGNFMGVGRMMRSIDGGGMWANISGGVGTGLPPGDITDLVADPSNNARLYCYVQSNGIYRSDNTGATWIGPLTNNGGTMQTEATRAPCGPTFFAAPPGPICQSNLEMAVSPTTGRLWVAIVSGGQPNWIGYSDDVDTSGPPTATWTELDLPLTSEVAGGVGLAPTAKPGAQGAVHLSVAADPADDDIVYVGGDRQPGGFPNDIGALDFSGRLFRGDASVAPNGRGDPLNGADMLYSPQWAHLTHTAGGFFPAGGTASGTAPHADSREMLFDANGTLIEGDDGGIYRRTSPTDNTGDWVEITGTGLQITEAHDVTYDTVSDILMIGNQDTGTAHQTATGSPVWTQTPVVAPVTGTQFSKADGGDVNVDPVNPAGMSTRYSSIQNLGGWRRQVYTAANALMAEVTPTLTGGAPTFQFKTPVELNRVNPLRLIIGGSDDAYESVDQGDNIAALGLGGVNRPGGIAYGAGGNADFTYVASGGTVFVRTVAAGAFAATVPGGTVVDLEVDPNNGNNCAAVSLTQVFWTTNAGAPWMNITGDLVAVTTAAGGNGTLDLRTVTYVANPTDDAILVGNINGVYATLVSNLGVWFKVGTGLPDARVYELVYDPTDDLLVASTLGQGVWTTPMVTTPSDVTDPVIACTLGRTLLWPATLGLLPLGFTASATDNQPPPPQLNVTVYSDEPDGAAPYAPDAVGTTPPTTRLRAERAFPGGNGRVYLLKLEAFDAAGNLTTICKSVVVPTLPTLTSIMAVRAEAMAGEALCLAAAPGVTPAGFTELLCYTAP